MNWNRIKTIFIMAFLILNSFLGHQLWEKYNNKLELALVQESSVDDLLQTRNIRLEARVDSSMPLMSQLNTQFTIYALSEIEKLQQQEIEVERHVLVSRLKAPFQLEQSWNERRFFEQFVQPYIYRSERYVFDHIQDTKIVYHQQIDTYPIFIGSLTIQREGDMITGYTQVAYDVVSKGTEQQVISSLRAIRQLIDIIPADSVIQSVDLGYFGRVYEIESQVLTPVWRIKLAHQDHIRIYYINAYTGALESTQL
jgi:regulatory protein YycI of two-component signal transduction system YycFG